MSARVQIDKAALAIAVTKLRRLRLEDVGGRKERPAETVASALDRGFGDLGSTEGVEYILRHGLKYYLAALVAPEPPAPRSEADIRNEGIEAAAGVVEAPITGGTFEKFIVNGVVIRNDAGHDLFMSVEAVADLLKVRATAIRSLKDQADE